MLLQIGLHQYKPLVGVVKVYWCVMVWFGKLNGEAFMPITIKNSHLDTVKITGTEGLIIENTQIDSGEIAGKKVSGAVNFNPETEWSEGDEPLTARYSFETVKDKIKSLLTGK